MERGASGEVEELCAEVRRLYAVEEATQNAGPALNALMSATHQQLHAAARTLESAIRLNAPPEATQGAPNKAFRFLGENEQPTGR
jgi:hypothetical protein